MNSKWGACISFDRLWEFMIPDNLYKIENHRYLKNIIVRSESEGSKKIIYYIMKKQYVKIKYHNITNLEENVKNRFYLMAMEPLGNTTIIFIWEIL